MYTGTSTRASSLYIAKISLALCVLYHDDRPCNKSHTTPERTVLLSLQACNPDNGI